MSTDPHITKAVKVHPKVTINHWELGRMFGEWNSVEQFHFLHGAATAFNELGGNSAMQMHYIADEGRNPQGIDVALFIDRMHDYLGSGARL